MSRSGRLARFVPPFALDWLADSPETLHRGLDGTWLFTDVAGFTAVTERLSARGRVGAEELVETLSGVLDAMVAVAHGHGGQLVKFAGDALLFYFDGHEHALRATVTATELRTALRTATRIPTALGQLELTASTGVHTGAVDAVLAGHHHREVALVGPVVSRLLDLEGAAVAGEVLVSAETSARLPDGATTPRPDGMHTVTWQDAPDVRRGPRVATVDRDDLARGLLPGLVADVLVDRRFDPAHRVATMGFLRFGGTDALLVEEGRAGVAERIGTVLDLVQDAFAAEDVALLSVDAEPDGVKVFASAGVPLTSEDDEGRLLRACRAVVAADPPLPVQVGINRGHVFAAELGTGARAAFSAMGDTVNTAARICSKAPAGSVWAHPTVREHARQRWEATPRGPFAFKGKSEPQPVDEIGRHLGPRRSPRHTDSVLVGRDQEVADLAADVGDALAGGPGDAGGIGGVEVRGAVGVGKSRLVDEALTQCDADVLALHAEPYGTATPYRVMRDAVRSILGIERGDDDRMAAQLLAGIRRLVPQHEALAALLGDVVAVDVPASDEVRSILPRYRPDRTLDVLVDLLAAVHDRLVIRVEDAHWADAASSRLLTGLHRVATDRPWCVVVVRRDDQGGHQAPPEAPVHEVEPLSDGDLREVVLALSADDPLLPHAVDEVVRRAAGNPLFATELVLSAAEGGGAPDSLQGAITARVDALPPTARRVLSYASVLGVSFRRPVLDEVLASERLDLDPATLEELRRFLEAGSGDRLSFRVGVVRDVVYDGLGFRLRSRLHGEAAAAVERLDADDAANAGLLALHWSQAGEHDRALPYALAAADRAELAHANEEAAANLELALAAVGTSGGPDRAQARTLWLRLGDARDRAGGPDPALDAYRRAARLCADVRERAEVGLRRVGVREQQGAFPTALREVTVIRRDLADDASVAARRLRASAAALGAVVRQRQERPTDALARARQAVAEAEACDEQRARARAESVLAWAAMVLDLPERDQHLRLALQLFEDAGDLTGVAHIANNLGVLAYYDGDWAGALSWYDRAEEALRRTGNIAAAALTAANAGELLVNQHRLDEAEEVLRDAARVLRVVGHKWGAPFADMHRGRLELARGRTDQAVELLEACVAEFEAMGSPLWIYEAALHLTPAMVRRGEPDEALARLEAMTPDDIEGIEMLDAARAWAEGMALAAVGRSDAAADRISAGLLTARRRGLEFDLARLLLLADDIELHDPAALGTETPVEDARALLDRLGVDHSQRGSPHPS